MYVQCIGFGKYREKCKENKNQEQGLVKCICIQFMHT